MTLLPFYGVGLPGQVISCQPWLLLYTKTITLFDHYETYKQGYGPRTTITADNSLSLSLQ